MSINGVKQARKKENNAAYNQLVDEKSWLPSYHEQRPLENLHIFQVPEFSCEVQSSTGCSLLSVKNIPTCYNSSKTNPFFFTIKWHFTEGTQWIVVMKLCVHSSYN